MLFSSVITIVRRIRIVAWRWVWRVIFFVYTTFSSYHIPFSLMMSLTMMSLGHLVCALFYFALTIMFWVNWWLCSVGYVRTDRSHVQSWLTHRNISLLKLLNFYHSLKMSFKIIVVLFLCFAHSIRCSFFNIMPSMDLVGVICWPSESGCRDDDGPQFVCCVDGRHPKVHNFWIFREGRVTPKVHLSTRVDIGIFVGDYFANNCLTPTWCRVPMFRRKLIDGSVRWLGFPSFLRNDGLPWTLNILAPYADWVGRGSSTSQNLSSGSVVYSDSIFMNCNWPACVLTIYNQRIFSNARSAARHARNNLLMENRMYRMQISSTCHNPIRSRLVNWRDDALDDR